MDTDSNKRVIRQLIDDVWRRGNLDALPLFWTDDCINHADASPEKRGLDALRRYHEGFGPWFQDFTDIVIEIMQQVGEADVVSTQIRLRARHAPTARLVSFDTIRIDKFRDEKIAEHWSVADMAALNAQLA